MIKELTLGELGLTSETIEGHGGAMTIEVPSLGLKIECAEQAFTGKILPEGKGNAAVTLKNARLASKHARWLNRSQ